MLSKLRGSRRGMIVPVAVIVILAGSAFTAGAASASRISARPAKAQGIVTSVGTVSTAGTCGVAGSAGTFTVVGGTRHVITTVDVTTTTTFKDSADATPSFLDVCVGSQIGAIGALSSGTLTATSVLIVPPRQKSQSRRNLRGHGQG